MENVGIKLVFDVKNGALKSLNEALSNMTKNSNNASASAKNLKGETSTLNSKLENTAKNSNSASASTKNLQSSFSDLSKRLGNTTLKLGAFSLALEGLSKLKNIIAEPLKETIALNAEMENLSASLATLINVNHQNITTSGRALGALEKYELSAKIAKKTINDLKNVGLELGYGVSDTAEMFKSFYSTAGSTMSLKQAQEALKVLASAGRIAGVSTDALKVSLDNVGSGIANSATDFGRFIASQGLTTEAMQKAKKEGRLYELILERLGALANSASMGAESYAISMEKLKDAIAGLKGDAGAEFFEASKESIRGTYEFLNQYKAEILGTFRLLYDFLKSIYELFKEVIKAIASTFGAILSWSDTTQEGISGVTKSFYALNDVIIGIEYVLKNVTNTFKLLIEGVKMDIALVAEYFYRVKDLFTKSEGENLARVRDEIAGHGREIREIFSDYGRLVDEAYAKMQRLRTQKVAPKASDLNFEGLRELKSSNFAIEKSKRPYDVELIYAKKRAELMKEGIEQKLALERANHALAMQNMRFETQERIKNNELTKAQASQLYTLEEQLHQKRLRDISELSEHNQALKNGLEDAFNNLFNGREKNLLKSFTQSLQSSMTKMFAKSLTDAIMQSAVVEAMKSSMGNAFSFLKGGVNGGIVGNLGGSANVGGGVGGGSGLLAGVGNFLGSFAVGSGVGSIAGSLLSTPENAQKTQKYAQRGALVGAAIGNVVPVIGTAIGAVVGGIGGALVGSFKSVKTTIEASGIEIKKANKNYLSGFEFSDKKKVKKSFWGAKKKTSYWTEKSAINYIAAQNIKNTFRSFEHILEDLGAGIKEISVKAGRYKDYASIAGAGAKDMIAHFLNLPLQIMGEIKTWEHTGYEKYENSRGRTRRRKTFAWITRLGMVDNPELNAIYNVWAEYAKSANTEIAKYIGEALGKYLKVGHDFKVWLFQERGNIVGAMKLEANLAKKQVSRLLDTLGAQNITIDNYLEYRERAIKENFNPEHIENINKLGEALRASKEATKKYEEALKNEKKTRLNLVDSYLKKTKKIEELRADSNDTLERLQVGMLSTLKQILRTQEELLNTPPNARI